MFVGLSVVPYVYYKEPPAGPSAGEFLQPLMALPEGPSVSRAAPGSRPAPDQREPADVPETDDDERVVHRSLVTSSTPAGAFA